MPPADSKEIVLNMIKSDLYFEDFFKHFYNKIYSFALSKCKNIHLSKEITQDTFYKIYTNKNKIDINSNYISYFYTIAFNEFRQKIRDNKEILLEDDILELLNNSDSKTFFEEEVEEFTEEDYKNLKNIMDNILTDEERKIIDYKYFKYKSIKEISEILNIKEGTVKSKISRSLEKIREKLKKCN